MPVDWLRNDAGPLLLLPEALLADWSGIDVPEFRAVSATFRWNDDEPRASDYDRACDVHDYVATIDVGYGQGLVLNDEPAATAFLPRSWGGIIVRWEYADSLEAMEAALLRIPDSLAWESKGTLGLFAAPQVLFNSAEPGMEPLQPRLEFALPAGMYTIRWTRYAPDPATAAGLIEIRRASRESYAGFT